MRLLLQRVTRAEVRVAGRRVGRIDHGLAVLVGVGHDDDERVAQAMAARCVDMRIFRDDEGRSNRSLADVGGAMLAVSQFTLYAGTRKGRRPSFLDAARAELGERIYEAFVRAVEDRGIPVARGQFGAEMEVELVNDGPMTIWLDSAGA
ncbi:D-aminoacyl-tRNA deacylase [soil metagenome]